MYRKELFDKVKTLVLGFVCAVSLTACTLNVQTDKTPDKIDTGTLAQAIDETDLTDKTEVAYLKDDIAEWSVVNGVSFQSARLVRVVDGDTIVVDIKGEESKVRLIGVNTPESVASEEYLEKTGKENTQEGKDASAYTKEILAHVQTVYLQTDTNDTDKYGRLLRYVWIELPDGDIDTNEIENKMLNGMLIAEGIGELEIYHPDDKYAEQFQTLKDKRGER